MTSLVNRNSSRCDRLEVYQRRPPTGLAQPGESKYQRPQSGAVNLADVFEI